MTAQMRKRVGAIAPWIALALTAGGTIAASAATWGQTCQRVDTLEVATLEHKSLVQTQIDALDERLRAVEQATQAIPGMAQDIRDIRDYLLEQRPAGGQQ